MPAPVEQHPRVRAGRRLVPRGAAVTAIAVAVGNVLGFVRDLMLAGYFGANGDTDAFLVAWTLPETAVPLLIDGAMTLLMMPIFARALRERESRHDPADPSAPSAAGTDGTDPVAEMVSATLPRLIGGLVVLAALAAVAAPWLVAALAPGLTDMTLGVAAMRIIAASVVCIGVAGYAVAALRSHLVYAAPALVTVAMNVGIIGCIVAAHRAWGVLAAVTGVVVGSIFMVAVQLPAFARTVGLPRFRVPPVPRPRPALRRLARRLRRGTDGRGVGVSVGVGALAPVTVYILARQAQVFVERFVASWLAPGTITHLNYAQKIAQVPTTLALTVAVVTFPVLARTVVAGDLAAAQRRLETDIAVIASVVLAATAFLIGFAPQVVAVLLQHGAFGAADTAATSAVLRVYVVGLLGQAMVDTVCRGLFSERAAWLPAAAMGAGLGVTAGMAAAAAPVWGAPAIAAANAVGITLVAVVLVASRRSRVIPARRIAVAVARLLPATAAATLVARWSAPAMTRLAGTSGGVPGLAMIGLGGLLVAAVFALTALVSRSLPGQVRP